MPSVIQVDNVSKNYILLHEGRESYTALRDVIAKKTKKIFSFPASLQPGNTRTVSKEEFWALKDISFDIEKGDRVGIIGRNGAGKSTLLKILSRIIEPTSGQIKIKGRIASLLEVGTGFHPELTGRENIFLNGAILGMSREEIRRHFDAIVDFSETEKFLDTPVKRYSSGMYVRLAFAVAAHLEPEILIIDEVLAVGDAQFQKKCLGKMEDVSKNDGRTVIFVSHNMSAIQNLCNTGIVLNKGAVQFKGKVNQAVVNYLNQFSTTVRLMEWAFENAPSNEFAKLLKAVVRPLATAKDDTIRVGDSFEFEFVFYNCKEGNSVLDITFHLVDEMGHLVYVGSTGNKNEPIKFPKGEVRAVCRIPSDLMHEGTYNISRLLLVKDRGSLLFEKRDVLQFEIIDTGNDNFGWMGAKEGIIKPDLKWDWQK